MKEHHIYKKNVFPVKGFHFKPRWMAFPLSSPIFSAINSLFASLFVSLIVFIISSLILSPPLMGCTMVLVGKKATADGSVLLAHNNDLPGNIASQISIIPAGKHAPGEMIVFKNGLKIPQVRQTYRMLIMHCYYGYAEGDAVAINQWGVSIAGGVALKGDRNEKAERLDPLIKKGVSGYIRYIALQRAKTARRCIEIMGELYSQYGISYPSGVGVADGNEVWYMEAGGGKCWAAVRVPDDCYLATANGYRIGHIDFNDEQNYILPGYLKKFLLDNGLWKGEGPKGEPFNFAGTFGGKKEKEKDYYNARRVWRIQRLLSPKAKSNPGSFTHPLMMKPQQGVTLPQLTALLRDYYGETEFDLSTRGHYEIISQKKGMKNGKKHGKKISQPMKERAIGVFNTVHTDIIQLRSSLPPEIGAVMWGGTGCSLATPYTPYYLGMKRIPAAFKVAGPHYDPASAFWQSRNVSMLAESRYGLITGEILPVWEKLESTLFKLQPEIEKTALELFNKNREAALDFLTVYSRGLALEALHGMKLLEKKLKTRLAETAGKKTL